MATSVNSEAPSVRGQDDDEESHEGGRPRRGSFSFLRRSKSQEITTGKDTTPDGKNRLKKNKSLSRARRRELREKERRSQLAPPRLPSYHDLPRMQTPFDNDEDFRNPTLPSVQPTSGALFQRPPTTSNSSHPPSSYSASPNPPSRSGYNPNAFYQRQVNNMDPASKPPVPPVPSSSSSSQVDDPNGSFRRSESVTNRGRYSYANLSADSHSNSPRRVRRRKDPTPLNILVIGTKNSGKTSLIEFLKSALLRPTKKRPNTPSSIPEHPPKREPNSLFTPHYVETELEGERLGITIYDSNGLDKGIIDIQLREITHFVDSKFQETFYEEQKVLRATGHRDSHIHCILLLLDPARLDLNTAAANSSNPQSHLLRKQQRFVGIFDDLLEAEIFRALQHKTIVVPVVSKADTITTAHMSYLKRTVWDSLKKLEIDPLEALDLDDSDDELEYDTASSAVKSEQDLTGSSMYDDASEGRTTPTESQAESSDVEKTPTKTKANGGLNIPKDTSKPPQHAETRFSAMSTNVDLPPLPLSIISPDLYEPGTMGRRFPWGFADPHNPDHCDFDRLKDSVFSEWRDELREVARERWYETWRTNRLKDRSRAGTLTARNNNTAYTMQPAPSTASTATVPTAATQQRSVSGAAAYSGKGALPPANENGNSSASEGRAVSAADIGVAVTNENANPSASMPVMKYRGVGTY